jgi:hypothetical protein
MEYWVIYITNETSCDEGVNKILMVTYYVIQYHCLVWFVHYELIISLGGFK